MIYRPPTTKDTAFNCPHCSALAQQFWHSVHALRLKDGDKPLELTDEKIQTVRESLEEKNALVKFLAWAERVQTGSVLLDDRVFTYNVQTVLNAHISVCHNCSHICLWINSQMIYPTSNRRFIPNVDLAEEAKRDYIEADSIVDLSARGACALLRLCIQKLCIQVGESGKNLNDDIASLVIKGLDRQIQQALDVVRVIGNNAVHPGEMDIKDDRSTAEALFGLINVIVDRIVTQPKLINDLYVSLPQGARDAVERRDGVK